MSTLLFDFDVLHDLACKLGTKDRVIEGISDGISKGTKLGVFDGTELGTSDGGIDRMS